MAMNMKSLIAKRLALSGAGSNTAPGTGGEPDDSAMALSPVPIPRSQSIQRLQIGLSGLVAMVLLVGLASIIKDRADQTEEAVIAEAGDVPAAETDSAPQSDPLADAGLVPDLPAEPVAGTSASPAPAQIRPPASNAPPQ